MNAVPCSNWRDCGLPESGCCALGVVPDATPGWCLVMCPHYDGPDRGDGDALKRRLYRIGVHQAVSAVSAAIGVDCGCNGRQLAMNERDPAPWVVQKLAEAATIT